MPLILSNLLKIHEKVISRRQKESRAIECRVCHCKVACLVFCIVLEFSIKLGDNIDIAIETIWFDKEHNPTVICLLNKCLVCADNIFTIPLVGRVWDFSCPYCIFRYTKVPLVVDDLLVGSTGTAVFIWWTNPIVHYRVLKWLWCCTVLATILLLTFTGLLRKWDWLITACRLSIIAIAQTLSTSTIKTFFAVVIWKILRFHQRLQNNQLDYSKKNRSFICF